MKGRIAIMQLVLWNQDFYIHPVYTYIRCYITYHKGHNPVCYHICYIVSYITFFCMKAHNQCAGHAKPFHWEPGALGWQNLGRNPACMSSPFTTGAIYWNLILDIDYSQCQVFVSESLPVPKLSQSFRNEGICDCRCCSLQHSYVQSSPGCWQQSRFDFHFVSTYATRSLQ